MEVSSHALALRRVDGTRFAAGVFTNLTRDHLDFHRDMEAYAIAKRRLFEMLPHGAPGIVNADDPRAPVFVEAARQPVTYGMRRQADVSPGNLTLTLAGLRFEVRTPAGAVQITSPLVGRPNVYNILAAVATAVSLGVPPQAVETGIASLAGVPGRFEVVSAPGDDVTVVVDYAHTDDALKNLLETVRGLAPGRVITVFGCGGDRDRTKRPLMGAVAGRMSDVVIVTSDNPRSEDPATIIDEVMRGMPQPSDRTIAVGDGAPRQSRTRGVGRGRPARGDYPCGGSGRHRRPRRARGQGTREGAGDRRAHAQVRRRGGGSRGTRAAPHAAAGGMTWQGRAHHSC